MLQAAYTLSYVCDEEGIWHTVAGGVHLQFGTSYGMLMLDSKCGCCNAHTRMMYFFTMQPNDLMRTKCIQLRISADEKSTIEARLPDGTWGHFDIDLEDPAFDDAYILRCATFMYDIRPSSVEDFLESVGQDIALCAGFKRFSKFAHRGRTKERRMAALSVLTPRVSEESIRKKIIVQSHLY